MTTGKRNQLAPAIHRVPYDKLVIWEVTDAELDDLERGSPDSPFLNLAISTISIAVSFSITLATTEIASIETFCVFVVLVTIGYLASLTFGIIWYRSNRSVTAVVQRIRNRAIPQGIQEDRVGDEMG